MKNNEPVLKTTTDRLKKLVSGLGKTDAVAACLATIMATSAALASCTLDTMGTCTQPCGSGSTPDAGMGGTAGTGGETAKGGEAGTGGVAGMGGSGGLDGGGGQSGMGGVAGAAGEGGVAGQGGLGGQAGAGGLDAGGAGQGGVAGQGGAINDGGSDADANTDAGCTDIPVLLTNMAEYDYKLFRGGCGPGNVVINTFVEGDSTFESGTKELCIKPGDKLVIQVKDTADLNSAEVNTPQGSIQDVGVTTLLIPNPMPNVTADSVCNNPGVLVSINPASDDKNPVSSQYKFNGNSDGDAGLPPSNAFSISW